MTEDGRRKTGKGKESISAGMTPFRRDDSLREWDGKGKTEVGGQTSEVRKQGKGFGDLGFHSTFDIIEAVDKGLLPDKIMINTHPQRWTDNPVEWMKELVWQNFKNVVKRIIVRRLHR